MGTANRIRDTLRQVSGDPDWKETDRELLRRFVEDRNEAAFTTLMRRHCRCNLGVGFRVLDCFQKAEDVCQATFLLLAKKAAENGMARFCGKLALFCRLQPVCKCSNCRTKTSGAPKPHQRNQLQMRD